MFYDTRTGQHGLARNPFKACVVPRPIGWISTLSAEGVANLAPYSFFNGVAGEPPMVMFASNGRKPDGPKDSITNCEATGEFVANMATWDLRDAMNLSSTPAPANLNEMELAGLAMAPSVLVKPPRVEAAPIHLECLHHQTVELPSDDPEGRNAMVIGRVIGIHIDESVLTDGLVDMAKVRPIARLGYMDYTRVDLVFSMLRPKWPLNDDAEAAE
jgi:flavin reductase (DIM6/NTAB) family NADH-FMN oxidoreductase RutF